MCGKMQKDLQDLQATLYEESQKSLKLSMEMDTKVGISTHQANQIQKT